jgi:hypothetical protein
MKIQRESWINIVQKIAKKVQCTIFCYFLNDICTFFERYFDSMTFIFLKKNKVHHPLEYLAASLVAQKDDR